MHLYLDLLSGFWQSLTFSEKILVLQFALMSAFGFYFCKISWDERKLIRTIIGIFLTTIPVVMIPLVSEILSLLGLK